MAQQHRGSCHQAQVVSVLSGSEVTSTAGCGLWSVSKSQVLPSREVNSSIFHLLQTHWTGKLQILWLSASRDQKHFKLKSVKLCAYMIWYSTPSAVTLPICWLQCITVNEKHRDTFLQTCQANAMNTFVNDPEHSICFNYFFSSLYLSSIKPHVSNLPGGLARYADCSPPSILPLFFLSGPYSPLPHTSCDLIVLELQDSYGQVLSKFRYAHAPFSWNDSKHLNIYTLFLMEDQESGSDLY